MDDSHNQQTGSPLSAVSSAQNLLAFAKLRDKQGERNQDMADKKLVASVEQIESRIFLIRGQKVMLDADLAGLYGVETKRLNEQVRRNAERFPEDFMFRLTAIEKAEVVANCDHLAKLKYSPSLPYAFAERGAIRQLMSPSEPKKKRPIGFAPWKEK